MLECLAEKSIIVSNKSIQLPPMYKVKLVFIQPFLLIVINLKRNNLEEPYEVRSALDIFMNSGCRNPVSLRRIGFTLEVE